MAYYLQITTILVQYNRYILQIRKTYLMLNVEIINIKLYTVNMKL